MNCDYDCEPYTDDQNYVIESGIPIRLYNGGKLQGAASAVPPIASDDEGKVLTVVDGQAEWEINPRLTWAMDPVYWLRPYCNSFSMNDMPYPGWQYNNTFSNQRSGGAMLGYPPPMAEPSNDELTIGSGNSAMLLVQLPTTTDGQTLATPRATFDASILRAFLFPANGNAVASAGYQITITTSASRTGTLRIIDGATTMTDANAYWTKTGVTWSGSVTQRIPSAINTTRTGLADPWIRIDFVGGGGAPIDWSCTINRDSFNT